MPRLLEMINVLGSHFWLTCFLRTFPSFLLTCTSTILILISILVFFCFMFMFPLLGDKQRFKFRGENKSINSMKIYIFGKRTCELKLFYKF